MKHGCCVDQECTPDTCMQLPAGETCAGCVLGRKCKAFLGIDGTETSCDWFPRRFKKATATPPPEVGSDEG